MAASLDHGVAGEIALVGLLVFHIIYCPYTKVEESFNLQATHDLLYYGRDIAKYDHLEFPGVVPRSFIGPLILALLSSPFVAVLKQAAASKLFSQYVVRFALGAVTLFAFLKYKRSVSKTFGTPVGNCLVLLTATQFHFMFYMSRPLPNTFALCLVLLALHSFLMKHHGRFIWASAYAIIIFRTELCILLGILLLIELGTRRLEVWKALIHSAAAGISALGLTIVIDSFFWQRPLWPEGEVFYFNAVLNKSSQWGTSPFLWYFYSVLPRVLLSALVLVPLGLWRDKRTWVLVGPALIFIIMFSFLPHKELRFIVYVFPIFNTVAACGLQFIFHNYHKWRWPVSMIAVLGVIGGLVCNCLATGMFLHVSHNNYPGGVAMDRIHQLAINNTEPVYLHIGVAAAETGVSRFGELHDKWRYSKAENLTSSSQDMLRFTHLLAEAPCSDYDHTHDLLEHIPGFTRITVVIRDMPFIIKVHTDPKICILQRRIV